MLSEVTRKHLEFANILLSRRLGKIKKNVKNFLQLKTFYSEMIIKRTKPQYYSSEPSTIKGQSTAWPGHLMANSLQRDPMIKL